MLESFEKLVESLLGVIKKRRRKKGVGAMEMMTG